MSRRHVGKLNPPAVEKRILADEKSVGSLPHEGCEGSIDFQVCAGFEDLHLQPHGAGSGFRRAQSGLYVRSIGWIDEHGHTSGHRHQLSKDFEPLCHQLKIEKIDACQVAAWSCEAG